MIPYQEFLTEIRSYAEPEYAAFHKRLIKNDNVIVLGVRVPQLRKLARKYDDSVDELLSFPDEYYEVTFIKLAAVSYLKWEKFLNYVDRCVLLIDNWATCDCFIPKCISKHRDEFLPYLYAFFAEKKEFYQRFALTTLLHFYVEEKYLHTIYDFVREADTEFYYVHMAAAWLIAEVLVKFYGDGVKFLKLNEFDIKTRNKAKKKACESYRLTAEQKTYLKGLKR